MVKITQVHIGSGDSGDSSLVDGTRRSKSEVRFEMVGTCDELNSIIGICLMEVARLESLHEDGGPGKCSSCSKFSKPCFDENSKRII